MNSAALVSLPLSGNALIYGDNLLALKYLIECRAMAGSVDLVYIDPPFSTNTDFTFSDERSNAVSRANDGEIAYTDKLK